MFSPASKNNFYCHFSLVNNLFKKFKAGHGALSTSPLSSKLLPTEIVL